jgi:HEAT repeat protein
VENAENEKLPEGARVAAMQALAAKGNKQKNGALFERLKQSKSSKVRAQAMDSLAAIGDKSSLNETLQMLRDSQPKSVEQYKAILALERMSDPRAIPVLQKLVDERKGGARARLAIAHIEFAQAKTDSERKESLRKFFRAPGAVGQWAAGEISIQQRRNPEFRQILEEAAADPKHPQSAVSKEMLKRAE